jgi:hypothetical protein
MTRARALATLALAAVFAPALHADSRPPARDLFDTRGWHAEIAIYGGLEAWNYNGSHEEMSAVVPGVAYGVGRGFVIVGRGMLSYVGQRGPDGFLLGTTVGVRGPILRRTGWSLFWEGDVGISQSDTYVPRRGTRFNYLAIGGISTSVRLRPGLHLLSGVRLVHISNGGLAGRDRNPDIEAIGMHVGLAARF